MTASARLVARFGVQTDKEYTLSQRITTVGREPINDVAINDPEISRRHARVLLEDGVYVLEDLGSTNGSFVNGQRLNAKRPLRSGDVIDFAETQRFTFVTDDDSGAPASGHAPVADYASVPAPTAIARYPDYADEAPAARVSPAAVATERVAPPSLFEPPPQSDPAASSRRGRYLLGCGCLLILTVVLCGATLFLLDAFNNGELLYCGPLRPLFETILEATGRAINCP